MEIIGEYVDRLITVEMRPYRFPVRGKIHRLYEYARAKAGVKSLCLSAATRILENVSQDDVVFVITGTGSKPFLPNGESDGPPGAASIARALSLGVGAKIVFVVGENDKRGMEACARAVGLNVEDELYRNTAVVVPVSTDPEVAEAEAEELIKKYKPSALFSIETLGPNAVGVYHTVLGFDLTEKLPKLHTVFDEAHKHGILTVAGIDGGNEIGSGTIAQGVREIMPYGARCQCACERGNACRVETDIVLPATTSNWAMYGVVTMLAFLLKKPYLLQDIASEHRMLEACVAAGVSDGMTFRPIMAVDGMSSAANEALLTLLHEIVQNGLQMEDIDRPV